MATPKRHHAPASKDQSSSRNSRFTSNTWWWLQRAFRVFRVPQRGLRPRWIGKTMPAGVAHLPAVAPGMASKRQQQHPLLTRPQT